MCTWVEIAYMYLKDRVMNVQRIYVDDCIKASDFNVVIKNFHNKIESKFSITELGLLEWFPE